MIDVQGVEDEEMTQLKIMISLLMMMMH